MKFILVSVFIKIGLVGPELFHVDGETDGQTDMTELIVAFLQFLRTRLKYVGYYFKCFVQNAGPHTTSVNPF